MKKRAIRIMAVVLTLSMLCCCFVSAAAAADDKAITRISSVMNGDTENSRGITWATGKKTDSIVLVSENEDMSNAVEFKGTVSLFKSNYMHKVVVDGLKADTTYYYTVGDSDTRSDVCRFSTDAGRGAPINFIAFADVQASSEENFEKSSKVLKAAYEMFPDADFAANLGDFVNDCTNEEWDWYFEKFADVNNNVSMVPVAGNHEGNLKWYWFTNMFNIGSPEGSANITGEYYSFDYGDAHFAVLNSNDMYPMSEQQINWLQNDMNNTDATWKIIMLHRSFYSAGKHTNKPDSSILRNMLIPIIDELDIDVVMGGHEHMYLRTYPVVGDGEITDTTYVKEIFNGEETTFALDPEGTIHVMPSTAGTKRYLVNDNTMQFIKDAAAVIDTTRDKGGIFTHVAIEDGKLVYKAYMVDDETQEVTLYDEFAIMKTTTGAVNEDWVDLPTDKGVNNITANFQNLISQLIWVIKHYLFELLPSMIIK